MASLLGQSRSYAQAIAFAQRIADAVNTLERAGCRAEYDVEAGRYRVNGEPLSDEDLIARAALAKATSATAQ